MKIVMLKKQARRRIQGTGASLSSSPRQQTEEVLTETTARHKKCKEVTFSTP